MDKEKRKIILSDFDHRLLVALLVDYRNKLLEESRSTEDINELLLKIIDSKTYCVHTAYWYNRRT